MIDCFRLGLLIKEIRECVRELKASWRESWHGAIVVKW